jgi:stage III sporulation protein AC
MRTAVSVSVPPLHQKTLGRTWMDIVFRIATIGILLAVLTAVLKRAGHEDIADWVSIAGLVVALLMVLGSIGELFENVKAIFML